MKGKAAGKRPVVVEHIKDLTPDPQNRRKHTARNIGMIADALQKVGAARSIVIDETGQVLAGNGLVEAAAEVGITKVQVVEADGDTVIAVRRRGLSAEQKRQLAIADNRAAELAEWDSDQLQADVEAGLDLKPWFSDKEAARVLGGSEDQAAVVMPAGAFQVLVTCADEQAQAALLERLTGEGYPCRALIS